MDMDASFLTSTLVQTFLYATASLSAFLGALLLSSAVRNNKGAKTNRAWISVSLGLILVGLSEGSKMADGFGFPLLRNWDGFFMAAGSLLLLLGAFLWRRIVMKAVS